MYIIQLLLLLLFYRYIIDRHDIDYISSYTLIGNRRIIFRTAQPLRFF